MSLPALARGCAAIALLIGAFGVLAWAISPHFVSTSVPHPLALKLNSAIAILLLSVSAFLPRRIATVLGAVVAVVSVAFLVEYALGVSLGIDQLVATDPTVHQHPGRLSIGAAVGLGLVGSVRVLTRFLGWTQLIALVVLVGSVLVLLGYAYRVHALYAVRPYSAIALSTAVALLLLSVAALANVRGGYLAWVVLGRDAGAQILRVLLPVAVIALPLLGLLCAAGRRRGWFDSDAAIAIVVVVSGVAVSGLTWAIAARLGRVDTSRLRAIDELTELKDDLERQVDERAAALQVRHDQIAVLEDRQRIAADLHDIVIQRLFAAGMFLQGAATLDAAAQERVDTAVESMDTAIKDLRASIFELGRRGAAPDLPAAIATVCGESEMALGFAPDVVVEDTALDAGTRRADLLAVLRESLANVARHAAASSVQVAVRAGDGWLSLTVTDDGRGMSDASRSSGTANMRERAWSHGGDCEWRPVQPHGTQVYWQVPLRAAQRV